MIREIIICKGHRNVKATHRSTFEITREDYLTERGDCIICISADKALKDLSQEVKEAIRSGKKIKILIRVGELVDEVTAYGDPRLTLESETSMVIRKSNWIDGRTLAIKANKAAKDIDRRIVERLKDPNTTAVIEIIVDDE
ncbi:DUF371 domain-containing protein [Pyrococcus furiosus DSM 3638]|nr:MULTISPECIES: DUF371 domain-containing protein [Pyrococcus]AFN03878.1 hypothetical protein PFC_04655 [Pyrococcus furiosus COM1]MDK2868792.1 uncharacterized protein [Pyrococcus sp.]QEK79698.1 DUF371 domain-containing protein [Pyrococcus furiosus DSM 3638]